MKRYWPWILVLSGALVVLSALMGCVFVGDGGTYVDSEIVEQSGTNVTNKSNRTELDLR